MDWKDSEYLTEEEFEQYLLGQGVTLEELAADLDDHLTLDPQHYGGNCQIFAKDGESIRVYAEGVAIEDGGISITRWLDNMSTKTFQWFWERPEERNKIKSLMRYPGTYHEWLMLAAIPLLKVMGIPMKEIMQYRTPIRDCHFLFGGEMSLHGGKGSTIMHNDLYSAIQNACAEWVAKGKIKETAFPVLRKYLRRFAEKYYCNRTEYMPEALKRLTGM